MDTACTTNVRNGMEVDVSSPEIADIRKAVVEMLFAEGNHNCPACTKSGNCDLQRRGYEMGLSISRFPHLLNVVRVILAWKEFSWNTTAAYSANGVLN